MNPKKLGLAAVSVLAAGTFIGASAAMASADTSPSPSASSSASSGSSTSTDSGTRQAPVHTAATADETQKVKDAVAAKDSTVTITTVQKDEDGSFDADGTKADGTKVRYDVSADYATVTEGRGGHGGPGGGGSQDTPVTGDEATKVIDAVKAKDSTVTIDTVRKDPDGSYDALGTKADGTKVMFDVSADLATISDAHTGGPGGKGGPAGSSSGSTGSGSSSSSSTSSAAPTT